MMFWCIFAMCCRTYQRMDALERHTDILQRNQTIIHNQRDDPLLKFPEDQHSLAQAELVAFGVGISRGPPPTGTDDDDDEEANDNEEMEDDE
jgi:hypothetical protein